MLKRFFLKRKKKRDLYNVQMDRRWLEEFRDAKNIPEKIDDIRKMYKKEKESKKPSQSAIDSLALRIAELEEYHNVYKQTIQTERDLMEYISML